MLCYIILYYVILLCCFMLHYVILYHNYLCYVMLYYFMLFYFILLYCFMLRYVVIMELVKHEQPSCEMVQSWHMELVKYENLDKVMACKH